MVQQGNGKTAFALLNDPHACGVLRFLRDAGAQVETGVRVPVSSPNVLLFEGTSSKEAGTSVRCGAEVVHFREHRNDLKDAVVAMGKNLGLIPKEA